MTSYVEWSTPWQYGGGPMEHVEVISRMKLGDAVKYYRGLYPEAYKDLGDGGVLLDFMDVRWAKIVEVVDD